MIRLSHDQLLIQLFMVSGAQVFGAPASRASRGIAAVAARITLSEDPAGSIFKLTELSTAACRISSASVCGVTLRSVVSAALVGDAGDDASTDPACEKLAAAHDAGF